MNGKRIFAAFDKEAVPKGIRIYLDSNLGSTTHFLSRGFPALLNVLPFNTNIIFSKNLNVFGKHIKIYAQTDKK